MYQCPECHQPLRKQVTADNRIQGYYCDTPSCEVISAKPRHSKTGGFREIKRVAVARTHPLTWLTLEEAAKHPEILEMHDNE